MRGLVVSTAVAAVLLGNISATAPPAGASVRKPARTSARSPARRTAAARPASSAREDRLTLALGPKAPFARLIVEEAADSQRCGSLGCEISVTGVTRTGTRRDLTQRDISTNGFLGTARDVFGAVDGTGMPRLVLEQGNIDRPNSHNLFAYDAKLGRYRFITKADVDADWHVLLGRTAAAGGSLQPRPAPVPPTPEEEAMRGLFAFTGSPDATCPAYRETSSTVAATALMRSKSWPELVSHSVRANCESVDALINLGIALYGLEKYPAAIHYFSRAITVQQSKWSAKIQRCRGFLCGSETTNLAASYIKMAQDVQNGTMVRTRSAPAAVAPAPAGSTPVVAAVWSLGRARYLAERGGACSAEGRLGKAYCFDDAIGWLRRHPDKGEIDAVAMDQSWMPGSFIPHAGGQGWAIFRISRAGQAFRADRQLHYAVKIALPSGCRYLGAGEKAWYISVVGGRKAAIEAGEYRCVGWTAELIDVRAADVTAFDGARIEYVRTADAWRDPPQGQADGNAGQSGFYALDPAMVAQSRRHVQSLDAIDQATQRAVGSSGPQPRASNCVIGPIAQAQVLAQTGQTRPICPPIRKTRRR
jgi:hypothetical protein